jgi:TPR repeat protein
VLFDDHHETFSTHTIPEAKDMTRIKLALAAVLSLAFTPVAAQDFSKGYDAYQAGDYATALQEWTPLAEAGKADAQTNLGYMYDIGQGVLQDYAEAVRWYRLAADQGHASAQYNLGVMYENGQGVLQDNVMAHMWYNIGAANGDELGGEQRDSIAEGMTQQAIEQAQAMARECMSSGYTKCGY